ncbi:hypothetical protein [Kitasatospora sp. NBC_00039]|uniref:hypothetical protein n=1 Tax=Kitasatospora sp. NBC_00039 TaxID=2903565 RepID=UPI00325368B9
MLDPYPSCQAEISCAEIGPRTGAVVRTRYAGAGLPRRLAPDGRLDPGGVVHQDTTTGVLGITADE